MLSSLKKTRDLAGMPAWHPNFRNLERLPDTKAVRTSFSVNGLAVFFVIVLVLYAGYKEYKLNALRSDAAIELSAIQGAKASSDQAVALFKKFQEEEKKVIALQQFLSTSRIVVSDFILQLGGSIPSAIKLYSIECKPAAITLRGVIEGAPDEASGRAVAYVDQLRIHGEFSKLFDSVSLTNIVRDPGTGLIQFVIDLKMKEAPKTTPKGSK